MAKKKQGWINSARNSALGRAVAMALLAICLAFITAYIWEFYGEDLFVIHLYQDIQTDAHRWDDIVDILIVVTAICPLMILTSLKVGAGRQKAIDDLEESERWLRRSQKFGLIGSWELEIATGNLKWSDYVYTLAGMDPETFQPNIAAFLETIPPEEHAILEAAIEEALSSDGPRTLEHSIVKPDGSKFMVREVAERVLDEAGKPVSLAGTVKDITASHAAKQALVKSEEWLSTILKLAQQAIISVDCQSRICMFNEGAEQIFGWSADEIMGKSLDLLLPDEVHTEHPGLVGMFAGEPDIFSRRMRGQREVSGRRKDGEIFPAEASISKFGNGEDMIFTVILSDLTARKLEEEQLRQVQKIDALGQLTGGIAHDFNNILNVVIGNLDLLEERMGDDPEASRLSTSALDAALRGADLTQRLLTFSRKEAVRQQPVRLNEFIAENIEMTARTIGGAVEINILLDENATSVMTDIVQAENALLNMLINSRDALSGEGDITVSTKFVEISGEEEASALGLEAGPYNRLSVTDAGCGIKPEELERVFEPFYTTKPVGQGSGLGLSTVYGFANQSGGAVTIDSEVGVGTTVNVFLPAVPNEDAPMHKAAAQPGSADRDAAGMPEKILVVEDDQQLREIAEKFLSKMDYDVTTAEDGVAALKILRSGQKFDLLFTDVLMPGGVLGHEVAREAERINKGVKLLFTSGYAKEGIVKSEIVDQGYRLLQKPYRKADLATAVNEVLCG